MNKIYTFLAVSALMFSGSCSVNNDYDLSNVQTDDIVIGDEFVVPVGTVSISLDELLADNAVRSTVTYDVPETFGYECEISAGIAEDIVDVLTENGEIILGLTATNPTELNFTATLSFVSATGESTVCFEGLEFTANAQVSADIEIDEDMLNAISGASYMTISCVRGAGCPEQITVDSDTTIDIAITITKTGGISL